MAGHRPLRPHQSRDWNVRFLRVKAPAWVTNAGRSRFTRSCCILGIKGPAQAPSNQEAVCEPCAARVGVHALSAAAPPTDDVLQRVSSLRQGSLHLTTGEMPQDLEIREILLFTLSSSVASFTAAFAPRQCNPSTATHASQHSRRRGGNRAVFSGLRGKARCAPSAGLRGEAPGGHLSGRFRLWCVSQFFYNKK